MECQKQASEIFWWKNKKKYDSEKNLDFRSRLESVDERIKIIEDKTK